MDGQATASKLMLRAAWCRALAHGPCSETLAQQLRAIAREYEIEADDAAHRISDQSNGAAADGAPKVIRAFPVTLPADASRDKELLRPKEPIAAGD